ncbi:TPA: TerB N-terminal domain-containing protein [Streptococcus agalactiae]
MSKCLSCGKIGLFLKINKQGLCKKCFSIEETSSSSNTKNHLSDKPKQGANLTFHRIKQKKIPNEIFELLWFTNGKYKNYNFQDELSAINLSLPIGHGITGELGYYPSYSNMSTAQRNKYLNWLTDISQPVEIGYVFTFYYGLERFISNGDYEKVFPILLKLKKYHKNSSFQFYTNSALALIALKTEKVEYLNYFDIDTLSDNAFLALKFSFNHYLTPKDIMKIHKLVNFTNTRYIKNEAELFQNILSKKIKEDFNSEYYIIKIKNEHSLGTVGAFLLGNISLYEREIKVIDIISDKNIYNDLYSLLSETHEETKLFLKRKRKTNKEKKF